MYVESGRNRVSFNPDWKYVVSVVGGGTLISIDNKNRFLDVYRCYGAEEGTTSDLGSYLKTDLYACEKNYSTLSIFYISY